MIEHVYTVSGMSCGHCAQSVTEEITTLAGVAEVDVDVAAGRVTVRAESVLAEADIRTAVAEAGFTFEGSADLVS